MSKAGVPIKSEGLLWYTINWSWPGIHKGQSLGKTKKSVIKEAKRPDSGAMTAKKWRRAIWAQSGYLAREMRACVSTSE